MSGMFAFTSVFNQLLNSWDVSSVTDMSDMFNSAFSFNGDLSSWDVSSVTDMASMFFYTSDFDGDLSGWDVSSVTDMSDMFNSAFSFNGDLSSWDVSSVTDMASMFFYTSDFDGDLSGWDVSSVTDMAGMFNSASSFNGDLSSWDVSSVTDMSYMFSYSSFNGDLSGWDVSGVTYMEQMFQSASFNGNLGNWYITLDNASVTGILQAVGNITPQNEFLATHEPTYSIGSSSDSEHFGINGAALVLMTIPDANPAIVNITSTGDFGTSNSRIFEITILPGVADTTNPRLASIERSSPTSQNTDSQSLIYEVTFSESVTGVTSSDFILSLVGSNAGTGSITGISGSGSVYYVTVSAAQDGTYNLDLVSSGHGIRDAANNLLNNTTPTTGTDETYTVSTTVIDNTNPRLASIERYSPAAENTDSQTLVYKVTFSENVTGVDTSDFTLSPDSTGNSTGSGQFTQTRTPAITIPYDQIVTDTILVTGSGTATSVSVAVDIAHPYIDDLKVDLIAPDGTVQTLHDRPSGPANIDQTYTPDFGSVSIAGNWTLQMHDDYSADDGILNSWMLTVNHDSDIATHVTSISGSGDVYYATLSAAQDGTYNLDLVSSGHSITDAAANPLTDTIPTTGTDETYTVSTTVIDNTNPRLASIERYTPATENTDNQTLVYKATFSEDVTGVTVSDFTLSSDSAGGESTSTSTGQFTQTRSPHLTIPDLATVSDTITVPDSETATSVSVEVDITHNYIGDLKIDIIAPDGTSITLHDNSGGSTDNIDQPYAPLFGSIPISGVWTLQIHDRDAPDPGVLNSWTLTINYSTTTTVSPVTGISGSGDVYYVTVSAAQDGTYNLDLVSSDHNIVDAANNSLTNTATTGADQTYTVSTAVIDNTNPRLASIERSSPTSQNTDSQSLLYKATFSEDVTGVTASDFVLSPSSTGRVSGTTQVTGISGSGDVYYVTVSATQDGTYNLDLVSSDHNIVDAANNSLTNTATTGADQTYTVSTAVIDNTNPRLASIERSSPTSQNTDSQSLLYKATFSEDVTGVTASDFVLSPSSTGRVSGTTQVTGISGSSDTYYVTVSSSTDGTYNLDLVSSDHNIVDAANNSLTNTATTGADQTYTVSTAVIDNTNPRLASIERYTPATENTDNQTLVYKATFSEDVTGVTVSDFTLSSDSAGGESTSTSTGQFTQTRSPHLTIPDLATVSDTITVPDSETATSVSVEVDITHNYIGDLKIDIIAPDGTSITLHDNSGGSTDNIDQPYAPLFGSIPISGVWTLQIHDRDAPDPGVLNSWTLTINYSTTTTVSPVTGISGSGDVYYVTVSAAQDGTYNLDLVSSGHGIRDAANNLLNNTTPTTGTDETYTVSTTVTDNTNPRLASIERYSPAAENTDSQTLVYKVTFSENVTGVDTSDFTLSPDSTGNGTGSGQFTQTRTPAITIPYDQIVTDTILVTGSGTATSVSVAVDIAHQYVVDLKVDLIAPDGTVQTLHDHSSGSANIDQTYTPDFGSVSIAGNWTLQMHDDYSADDGILNSWMLTVNHDSDIATHVTSISGSGDVYYATLSAAQDGTYNLDLVSSGHSITDAAANPLTDTIPTTGTDETYTVSTTVIDTINPRLASIERSSPTSQNTDSQSLIYEVTFSESVTGVTSSDFILSLVGSNAGTGSITGISGSGSVYYVTVSAAQDGTYNLDLVSSGHGIRDAANNLLNNTTPTTGTDETYTVSTTVTDNTNPRLASIERYTPATENTDNQTLVYKATFSEDVTGVTVSDFTLSSDSAGGESTSTSTGQFTQTRSPNLTIPDLATVSDTITVPDSETATSVSVEVDITHNYIGDLKIDIIAPDGTSITLHDNSGGSTDNIDQPYAPLFGSIPISGVWTLQIHDRTAPDPGVLNSWTLTINYGTTTTVSPVTDISGSGDVYYVTVSALQDGTYNLDLVSSDHNIVDAANNPLTDTATTGADQTYTVSTAVIDNTNPRLASIERSSPTSQNTDSQSLLYKATFSEDVTGVTVSDFTLSSDSAGGESTSTSTGQFTQTRSPHLTIPDLATVSDTITVSSSGTVASVSVEVDITHNYIGDLKIDIIAPDGTSITLHDNSGGSTDNIDQPYAPLFGSIPISGVWTLQIHDRDAPDPGVLNSWTLTINYSDTATTLSSVTDISGSGDVYYVTVSATQDGTYNLDLVSSDHNIVDAANNPLTNTATTGADQTYTVSTAVIDNTNPRLASIERYNPATENTDSQTLVYKATFSEDVTGVTVSDFTLSSDSAGGESTSTSTGQFTQTRSPNLTIPDLATVSDTITVSSSGTATSVSVEVDITHNYIGDLKIDIIAPDGTSITLHDNSGGSTDNIDQPYAPLFGSIPISGVWTLQIHDRTAPDPGVLNSWTLTINYGTTTTVSSVTDISGSGDVYYVTVSATQDGTYNLDLVSSDHNIADAANNSLTNTATTGADQTYTVSTAVIDNTNPRLASIERSSPTSQNTDSQSLLYKATFSEDVTGVTASDFVLSPSSTGRVSGTTQVTGISGSGDTYYVTVSSSTDGTYNLDLVSSDHNIVDAANNSLTNTATTGADQTYTVSTAVIDNTNPRLASIERYTPATENTDNQTLVYKATFSEDVTGVTVSDFTLSSDSAGGESTSTSTGQFTQTRSPHLTIPDLATVSDTITVSSSGTATSVSVEVDITHNYIGDLKIDIIAPDGTSITLHDNSGGSTDNIDQPYAPLFGSIPISGVWTLQIHDRTAPDPGVLNSWTLTINYGTTTTVSPVTGISGSGDVYYVTVSATQDGTYNLDLVSSDHNIADAANNSLTNTATTGADQTYTVSTAVIDNTNPRLASIERYTPATENTDSQSLLYKATFSEDVTGVTASDFVLSPSSTGRVSGTTQVTGISGSGDTYYVTVSSSTDGTYNLDLVSSDHNIVDAANNSLTNTATTGADQTYTVSTAVIDNTNPRLASIERYTPATENTDNQTLVYKATFSEDVTGVTVSDFTLSSDSAGGESTSTSTGQFTQTRSPHLTIPNLATVSDTITVSSSGTVASVSVEVDITHNYIGDLKIDIIAPDGTSITLHDNSGGSTDNIDQPYAPLFGSIPISGVWTLQIHDRDAPDPGVLNSWTLTINYSTTTTVSPVTGISGSGDVYYVTVSATQDGTYNLDLVSSGHGIRDAANNLLNNTTPTTGTDETYTVSTTVTDNTNPRLASIERYSPAAENTDSQTLVYKVTFSENVTGVDTSDFTLSPDSTGNGTGSGQFTQTRTPAITIPYDQIVTDTILVTGSGTATSVSVAVDIAHQYVVDLKVDLIAPDGTVQTLHDHSSGSANIDQTYTPDFGSVSIAGNWTLQMHDDYSADDGILNSWMLTVNHDSDIATHVTSISGSGDVYYATLSAAQDGTYNLDLVSSGHSITDAAANPLTDTIPTTGTDETYTVSTIPADVTAPTLASIERYSPAAENTDSQTLVYKVTFSENVTGVDASDFILSPDSTGGGTTTTSAEQFTQTRSPNLAIPDLQTVSDTITVSDSGTVTSVSVAVDITHTYSNAHKFLYSQFLGIVVP